MIADISPPLKIPVTLLIIYFLSYFRQQKGNFAEESSTSTE